MQGFINTTAGLRPLLLEGIEQVAYQLYSTPTASHGILSIKYVPNQGIGGGNIYVYLPYYENTQFPLEQFWNWVSDVSMGAVGKTLNNYLDNKPFVGIQYASNSSNYTQSFAYVAKLADDATIDDACDYVFETADLSPSGINTFTNVVTDNSNNTNPNVGDRVYVATNQGYDPFGDPLSKGNPNDYSPSPNNPVLLDGIYAFLAGVGAHPGWNAKGTTEPQSGNVFRVQIRGGIIVVAEACPVDFTQLGGVSEIDAFIYKINNGFPGFAPEHTCFDLAPTPPTTPTNSGFWMPVKLGFLLFPGSAPQPNLPEGPGTPYFSCNYVNTGGGLSGSVIAGMNLPQNADVYLKDEETGLYKKFANGNNWKLTDPNAGVVITYQYNDFYNGVIAVPPKAYYGTGPEEYAFEIDWGSDYPDEKGSDLSCEYFVRQDLNGGEGSPFYVTAAVTLDGGFNPGTGVIAEGWWPCSLGAS